MEYGDLWWMFAAGWGGRSAIGCLMTKKQLQTKANEHEWGLQISTLIVLLVVIGIFLWQGLW